MLDDHQNAWDELKILQDSFMKILQMYITWFTWSLGANLLAISWIVSAKKDDLNTDLVAGLGAIMVFALALSIFGCYKARVFFLAMEGRGRALVPRIGGEVSVQLIFGGVLARHVYWLIPLTLCAVLFGWALLVRRYSSWSLISAWFL